MTTELTVFDRPLLPEVIFKEGGSQSILDEIKAFAASIDKDISTEAGRDNIRSVAYKITRTKTTLDKMGEQLKDDAQNIVDAVNKERRHIRAELETLQEEVRQPLTDWENKEKKRVLQHEAGLKALELQAEWRDMPEPDAAGIRARIEQVSLTPTDNWDEFTARAVATKETVLRTLGQRLEKQERQEAEQAELQRLRDAEAARVQKDREDGIAAAAKKAAEDKAAADAEAERQRVERERVAAEKKAADDAAAAAKALQDAEDKRVADLKAVEAAHQKQLDDAAAAKKAAEDAAAMRAADTAHKAKINNELLSVLQAYVDNDIELVMSDLEIIIKSVIKAIAQGKVPHVKINY